MFFLFFNKEYYTLEPINIDKEFCAQLSSSNITLIFRQYLASQLKIDWSNEGKLSKR